MPIYDYRCTVCHRELEVRHRMTETLTTVEHTDPSTGAPCGGSLERLISLAGICKQGVGQRPPSDAQIGRSGLTKYVRGAKGYEKAAGPPGSPNFIRRE